MKIEFRNTTSAGNNVRTDMFFDGIRVAELHCTPEEFDVFTDLIAFGIDQINKNGSAIHDIMVNQHGK